MTDPTELLPCPFCGGNARKVKHSAGVPGTTGYDRWHGVACAGCNACVGARDRRFRTSAAAIAVWNTRTTPQPTHAQAGAVPLTPDQVAEIADAAHREYDRLVSSGQCAPRWSAVFAHLIEMHHGIKGGQHG